jgi:hypothetical protein
LAEDRVNAAFDCSVRGRHRLGEGQSAGQNRGREWEAAFSQAIEARDINRTMLAASQSFG